MQIEGKNFICQNCGEEWPIHHQHVEENEDGENESLCPICATPTEDHNYQD